MCLKRHFWGDYRSSFSETSVQPFLPPANKVCGGYVFTRVCHSVHGGVPGQIPPRDQVHPREQVLLYPDSEPIQNV